MGKSVPSSVEDYLAIGEAAYLIIQENPSVVVSLVIGTLVAILASAYLVLLLAAHVPRPETTSEKLYRTVTPSREITDPLPLPLTSDYLSSSTASKHDPNNPPVYMSVIVPAYNESLRLPAMLAEAVEFLNDEYPPPSSITSTTPSGWEILIVDDGSTDDTSTTALTWIRQHLLTSNPPTLHLTPYSSIRVVTLSKNRGKGGAVTHGMRHIRGSYVVFADADGATKFSDLRTLLNTLSPTTTTSQSTPEQKLEIAVGSRAHMVSTPAVVKRSFIRNLLMYTFHTYLAILMGSISTVKDTQCGFKLFSREAVVKVFPRMHNEGWIFDVEVLLLAAKLGLGVVEVPVTWHEVEGTKMRLISDSLRMAWDLLVLRAAYAVGIYGGKSGI